MICFCKLHLSKEGPKSCSPNINLPTETTHLQQRYDQQQQPAHCRCWVVWAPTDSVGGTQLAAELLLGGCPMIQCCWVANPELLPPLLLLLLQFSRSGRHWDVRRPASLQHAAHGEVLQLPL
jgi:hypothetical protein